MNSTYLPVSDADRVIWLNHFASRIGQYESDLELTSNDVDSVQADADMYAYVVTLFESSHQYWQALSNMKKQLRSSPQQIPMPAFPTPLGSSYPPTPVNSGIFNRIAMMVTRIKTHSAYTATMGQDLGIIAPVSTFNPNDMTPILSVRIDAGHPLLRWKKGEADGVHIYVDRRDGNGFTLLTRTVKTSYMDIAPLPANTFTVTWDYKARYLIGDDEVGQFSTVISINVIKTV